MKKISSLKGKKDFQEVYKKGRKFQQKEVQITILKYLDKGRVASHRGKGNSYLNRIIYIGIPISKSYGNAVIRNKAKRRIRAICRDLLRDVNEGYFIIIRPSVDFKKLCFTNMQKIIESLLKKSGVLQ
ncbi:MAG: ribonuclease P protein component [Spirochaetota bacterium]|nr:ribonuclease P protein component [Spirochaetota bacterium]